MARDNRANGSDYLLNSKKLIEEGLNKESDIMFANRDEWYDVYMLQRMWRILANNVEYDRLNKSVDELKAERGYRLEEVFANPFEYGAIKFKLEEKEYGSDIIDGRVYPKEISANYWINGKKEKITITSSDLAVIVRDYEQKYGRENTTLYNVYQYEASNLEGSVSTIYSAAKCAKVLQKNDWSEDIY